VLLPTETAVKQERQEEEEEEEGESGPALLAADLFRPLIVAIAAMSKEAEAEAELPVQPEPEPHQQTEEPVVPANWRIIVLKEYFRDLVVSEVKKLSKYQTSSDDQRHTLAREIRAPYEHMSKEEAQEHEGYIRRCFRSRILRW